MRKEAVGNRSHVTKDEKKEGNVKVDTGKRGKLNIDS